MRFAVVLNNQAGTDSENLRKVRLLGNLTSILKAAGHTCHGVICEGGELDAKLKHAVAKGVDVLVVGGGDGSLCAAANVLANTSVALGILPMGTLNHLAKDLDIPLDLNQAIELLLSGNIRNIDVGEVNGKVFVNNASVGLYPAAVGRRERIRSLANWSKWPAMVVAMGYSLKAMRTYRLRLVTVNSDDLFRTSLFFVGNNEYQFQIPEVGSRACLDRGCLGLAVLRVRSLRILLGLVWHLILGKFDQAPEVDCRCLGAFELHSKRKRLRVALDGEAAFMRPPLRFRSLPGSLKVIAPDM